MSLNNNYSSLPSLFLGSTSLRRKWLLESLGLTFSIVSPTIEEEKPLPKNIQKGVLENAKLKGKSAWSGTIPGSILISADTLVTLKGKVLGKPNDRQEAKEMLELLSGRKHTVFTGIALYDGKTFVGKTVESKVFFKPLTQKQIRDYLETKEPYDKAGSYAIQGLSALFIKKIEGSYSNIMGLPIEAFLELLPKISKVPVHQFFL